MYGIRRIADMPTTIHEAKAHESVLRAWNILEAVKRLLKDGTPPNVVLALIEEMEAK